MFYALACVLFRCLPGQHAVYYRGQGDAALMHIFVFSRLASHPCAKASFVSDAPQALVRLIVRALERAERSTHDARARIGARRRSLVGTI